MQPLQRAWDVQDDVYQEIMRGNAHAFPKGNALSTSKAPVSAAETRKMAKWTSHLFRRETAPQSVFSDSAYSSLGPSDAGPLTAAYDTRRPLGEGADRSIDDKKAPGQEQEVSKEMTDLKLENQNPKRWLSILEDQNQKSRPRLSITEKEMSVAKDKVNITRKRASALKQDTSVLRGPPPAPSTVAPPKYSPLSVSSQPRHGPQPADSHSPVNFLSVADMKPSRYNTIGSNRTMLDTAFPMASSFEIPRSNLGSESSPSATTDKEASLTARLADMGLNKSGIEHTELKTSVQRQQYFNKAFERPQHDTIASGKEYNDTSDPVEASRAAGGESQQLAPQPSYDIRATEGDEERLDPR